MPNLYAHLTELKNELGLTDTDATRDAVLFQMLEDASREADHYCGRWFFVQSATKYYDVPCPQSLLIDDCLSISALTTDSEGDGTFDGQTWIQGDDGDYVLWPYNEWPKLAIIPAKSPTYAMARADKYVKAVGAWGHGDGLSATPYKSSGLTGTVATTTGITLTASATAATSIYPGQTVLVGTEQMFVLDVSTTSITVDRAVNGTTAAAHSAEAIYIYKYPRDVSRYVIEKASDLYAMRGKGSMQSEMIGQYQYQRSGVLSTESRADELLGNYVKIVA